MCTVGPVLSTHWWYCAHSSSTAHTHGALSDARARHPPCRPGHSMRRMWTFRRAMAQVRGGLGAGRTPLRVMAFMRPPRVHNDNSAGGRCVVVWMLPAPPATPTLHTFANVHQVACRRGHLTGKLSAHPPLRLETSPKLRLISRCNMFTCVTHSFVLHNHLEAVLSTNQMARWCSVLTRWLGTAQY
jgi:hypothetical protein